MISNEIQYFMGVPNKSGGFTPKLARRIGVDHVGGLSYNVQLISAQTLCGLKKASDTRAATALRSIVRPVTFRFFGKSVKTVKIHKMHCKLPSPSPYIGLALALILLMLAGYALGDTGRQPVNAGKEGGVTPFADYGRLGRSQTLSLLQKSIETIESQHSISAEITHRVDLFGKQFLGKGYYCEERSGPHPLVRFELKTPMGDSMSSLKQVSDGKFLWISRVVMGKASLARVDLARLEKAVGKQGRAGQGGETSQPLAASHREKIVGLGQAISLGGMPGLLRSLQASFDFESAESEILYSTPVWKLRGCWRTSKLAAMLPDQKEAIKQGRGEVDLTRLPRQVPDHVHLWLGKDDLLPYRIEYRRTQKGSHGSRAMVTMQLLKVSVNVPLDRDNFIYRPNKIKMTPIDQTDAYIDRIARRAKKNR